MRSTIRLTKSKAIQGSSEQLKARADKKGTHFKTI